MAEVVEGVEYVVDVAPMTELHVAPRLVLSCHCTVGVGNPAAEAVKLAEEPCTTVTDDGCIVMLGAYPAVCIHGWHIRLEKQSETLSLSLSLSLSLTYYRECTGHFQLVLQSTKSAMGKAKRARKVSTRAQPQHGSHDRTKLLDCRLVCRKRGCVCRKDGIGLVSWFP